MGKQWKGRGPYVFNGEGGSIDILEITDRKGLERANNAYKGVGQGPIRLGNLPYESGEFIDLKFKGYSSVDEFLTKEKVHNFRVQVYPDTPRGNKEWAKRYPEKAAEILRGMSRSQRRQPSRTGYGGGYGGYVSGVRGGIGSHIPPGAMWPTGGAALFDPQNRGYGPRY